MDGIYEKAHKMTKKICTKYKDIDYKTQFTTKYDKNIV